MITQAMQNVIETAQKETAFLLRGGIKHMFDKAGADLAKLKTDRCAWFYITPEAASEAVQKATHLFVATMKHAVMRPGGKRLWILADEMCTSLPPSTAQLVQTLFSLAPGSRVQVCAVAQSWPQLVRWAGSSDAAYALRASAGCLIAYGCNDKETANFLRSEAGQYTIWTPNSDVIEAHGSTPMGVDLLRDDELRAMQRDGRQVVFLMGSNRVVVMPRMPYFTIPELQQRAARNPYETDEAKS